MPPVPPAVEISVPDHYSLIPPKVSANIKKPYTYPGDGTEDYYLYLTTTKG